MSPKDFEYELPDSQIPEVAFLGRSNVGKSSLINALTNSRLARTSKTPGRTQQVNYYGLLKAKGPKGKKGQINYQKNTIGFLVDLPGYGYSKAPDQKVELWQKNTQHFLEQRVELGAMQRLYLLVDARRGMTDFDQNVMGWFDELGLPYTIVFTKADRVSRSELVLRSNEVGMRYHSQFHEEFGSQGSIVHITSSKSGDGLAELMWSIDADFLAPHWNEEHEHDDPETEYEQGK